MSGFAAEPVREDEREGLQALLRGASECIALLPLTSSRLRAVHVLQAGLIELLRADPEESRGRRAPGSRSRH